MGVGFTNNQRSNSVAYQHQVPNKVSVKTDPWTIVKGVGTIVATIVLIGGLVWGAASLSAGKASDEELDALQDRVELVEKNDIRQTVILEQIKTAVDKIAEKLDKVLSEK